MASSYHSVYPATAVIFSGDRVLRRAAGFQITPSKSFICLVALLCALALLLQIKDASAQCAAQDVMGNRRLLDDPSLFQTSDVIQSAAGTPVWKTVKVGTSASKWDLFRDLDAANCDVGDSAEQIFAQPGHVVKHAKVDTDRTSVFLAQLGLQAATLRDVYARAQNLGFALATAEVGPQAAAAIFRAAAGRVPQHRHDADRDARWRR